MLLLATACTPSPSPEVVETAQASVPPPPADAVPGSEPPPDPPAPPLGWRELEPGLSLGVFASPRPTTHGDGRITVLRADPTRFVPELHMLSAARARGETGTGGTAREWAEREGLVAAIIAAMFSTDFETSTHYMAGPRVPADPGAPELVNNGALAADNAMLAFGPRGPGSPAVRLYDRGCGDDFDAAHAAYRTRVQSIRMVDCHRANRWSQQPKQWSHAVVGVDGAGRLLFVHARSPWTTHDFVDTLLELPLDLAGLQYAEGGPEASLFVRAGGTQRELIGSYETGFYESDGHRTPSPLPNIIGLRRVAAPAE